MPRSAPDAAPRRRGRLTARPGRVPTGADVVRAAIASDVARLVLHDPPSRLDDEPEGVHQSRVATRRLRSNLETFAPLLRSAPCETLSTELRWLGRHLGVVRDLDVLHDRFARAVRTFDPRERDDAFSVLDALVQRRTAAAADLHELLDRDRYARLLARLGELVASPPLRRRASGPAPPFLADACSRRFAALEAKVEALPVLPSDPELHEVRKTAKPLRYAAEAAADVLGPACNRLARRSADLCDELGTLNDGARAVAWLASMPGLEHAPSVARLRSGEALRMADARAAWTARWTAVREAARDLSVHAAAEPDP